MSYKPKPGTGWERVYFRGEGYYLDLSPDDEDGPILTVAVRGSEFHVSRSPSPMTYEAPSPQDIGRVELDFGVEAWSIDGVCTIEGGQTLRLRAVKVRG